MRIERAAEHGCLGEEKKRSIGKRYRSVGMLAKATQATRHKGPQSKAFAKASQNGMLWDPWEREAVDGSRERPATAASRARLAWGERET